MNIVHSWQEVKEQTLDNQRRNEYVWSYEKLQRHQKAWNVQRHFSALKARGLRTHVWFGIVGCLLTSHRLLIALDSHCRWIDGIVLLENQYHRGVVILS